MRRGLVLAGLAAFIAATFAGGCAQDTLESARRANTFDAYASFLAAHPDDEGAAEAQHFIQALADTAGLKMTRGENGGIIYMLKGGSVYFDQRGSLLNETNAKSGTYYLEINETGTKARYRVLRVVESTGGFEFQSVAEWEG